MVHLSLLVTIDFLSKGSEGALKNVAEHVSLDLLSSIKISAVAYWLYVVQYQELAGLVATRVDLFLYHGGVHAHHSGSVEESRVL